MLSEGDVRFRGDLDSDEKIGREWIIFAGFVDDTEHASALGLASATTR